MDRVVLTNGIQVQRPNESLIPSLQTFLSSTLIIYTSPKFTATTQPKIGNLISYLCNSRETIMVELLPVLVKIYRKKSNGDLIQLPRREQKSTEWH